jgi:O-antigen ligase
MNEKSAMMGRFRNAAPVEHWLVAIIAISAVPLIQGLLTTTLDGNITFGQAIIRIFSLVTVLANLFVLNLAHKNRFSFTDEINRLGKIQYLILALLVFACLSVFAEPSLIIQSGLITVRYALQVLTLFALIFIISSCHDFDINRYVHTMTACAILYIFYIIIIALMVPHPSTFPWAAALPSATSIRHIGNYVAIFSIAAIGSFLFSSGRTQWLHLVTVFVIITFLSWSGSRAAFVGIGVALIISLIALRRHVSIARIGILAVTLGAATLATAPFPTPGAAFGVVRMINASDTRQTSDVSSLRIEVWQNTLHEIAAAPFLGHGAGRFANNIYEKYGYDIDNPHNFVLQFAYDWGIPGLSITLILLAMAGISLYRLPINSPIATFCAVSGFMLMITIGMLEGMFYHPMKMLLVSALVAPAFGLARRQKSAQLA